MQNDKVLNAVTWNPWHGCHKCSAGCKNCFVFYQDRRYGRNTDVVSIGKTTYRLKNCPAGSVVKLCFSSDFFIEEADEWRDDIWDTIRNRDDCTFVITTKRPERIIECLPEDWGDGWNNFKLNISVENQEMADIRILYLLKAPVKYRGIFCAPLIGKIELGKYLDIGLIDCVNVGGEHAPLYDVRPTDFKWVGGLFLEAKERGIEFYFHQTGSKLISDGRNIGAWNMKEQIKNAEILQKELERLYECSN